jgi:hypothetical protein
MAYLAGAKPAEVTSAVFFDFIDDRANARAHRGANRPATTMPAAAPVAARCHTGAAGGRGSQQGGGGKEDKRPGHGTAPAILMSPQERGRRAPGSAVVS